jgi:Integrase core domain
VALGGLDNGVHGTHVLGLREVAGDPLKNMRVREVPTAPRHPWQNRFIERLIGSVRRGCLDHVLVLSERHLRCILARCSLRMPEG